MKVRLGLKMLTRDCTRFTGKFSIANTEFTFTLQPTFPIGLHQKELIGKTVEEFRKVILIDIKKENRKIELLDDEYKIFYYLFFEYAVDLYNAMEVIKAKKGRTGRVSIIYGSGMLELYPEACVIISRPKFGCNLLEDEQGSELNGIN